MKIMFFLTSLFIANTVVANNQRIIEVEKKITDLNSKIAENNNHIINIEKKLGFVFDSISRKKLYVAKRMMALNQIKKFSWQGILSPKNGLEFDRNNKIFKNLINNDLLAIQELKLRQEEYARLKDNLKNLNISFEQDKIKLAAYEGELQKLELDEIKKTQSNLSEQTFLKYRGQLKWPLQQYKPKYKFGLNFDADTRLSLASKGMIFNYEKEQNVLVFGPGKVIFSDRLPYWGDSVIVSHDGDYFSLYAGMKNIKVQVNEVVNDGQILGQTGQADFYFELRHSDIPINPARWIRNEK